VNLLDGSTCMAEFAASVPSAVDHLDFQVQCTVWWAGGPATGPLAMWAAAGHACSILRRYHPTRWQLAGIELAAALAAPTEVGPMSELSWHARNVAVTVDDEDLESARQHASRQGEQVEAWAADHAELRYLRDTVLADPATATVWWFRHNEYDLTRVESTLATLRTLMGKVGNAETPRWVDQFLDLVTTAVGHLSSAREVELHGKLASVLDEFGAKEKAKRLNERFYE
jgi:hypothetical protein